MVACSLPNGHKLFSGRCCLRLRNIGNYRTVVSLGMLINNYQSKRCQDEESYNVTVTGKSGYRKNGWHRKAKVIVEMSAPLSLSVPRYRQKSLPIVPFKSPGEQDARKKSLTDGQETFTYSASTEKLNN